MCPHCFEGCARIAVTYLGQSVGVSHCLWVWEEERVYGMSSYTPGWLVKQLDIDWLSSGNGHGDMWQITDVNVRASIS